MKNGYHQDFQYLLVYIHFPIKAVTLIIPFMPDILQSRKKKVFDLVLLERHDYNFQKHRSVNLLDFN